LSIVVEMKAEKLALFDQNITLIYSLVSS